MIYSFATNVPQTILDAKDEPNRYPALYSSIIGTVFFGVPFRGTNSTLSQGEILARAAVMHGPNVYASNYRPLRQNDDPMHDLLTRYTRAISDGETQPHALCFYERKKSDMGALLGREYRVRQSNETVTKLLIASGDPRVGRHPCQRILWVS